MRIIIDTRSDSDNSSNAEPIALECEGPFIRLTLRNPDRVITVPSRQFSEAVTMLSRY